MNFYIKKVNNGVEAKLYYNGLVIFGNGKNQIEAMKKAVKNYQNISVIL